MKNRKSIIKILFALLAVLGASPLFAVGTQEVDKTWYRSDGTFWLLIIVIAILFYVIYALAEVVVWSGKKKIDEKKKTGGNVGALLAFGAMMLISSSSQAQATDAVQTAKESIWQSPYLPLYILIAIEIAVIAYLSLMLGQLTRKEKSMSDQPIPGLLSQIWEKWNYKVPIEREAETLLVDHEYDGIQELDNSMPPWLQYIFYFTIVFAIVYLWYYNIGNGPTQIEEYNTAMEKARMEKAALLEKASASYDENTVVVSDDAAVLANGKATFIQWCTTCHGNAGEGGVGPNLTDDYWIHGGSISNVFHTIYYGVPEKSMASWGESEVLTPKQIFEVANYIRSLHGTNPPNAKDPQGDLYDPNAATAPADSANAATPVDSAALQTL